LEQRLLDAADYKLISQFSLVVKRRVTGMITGEQRSPALSGGIEFADYRAYQPGDDVRRIDWSAFLRLRRLLVKLCAEEKELTLMLMLDISRSMRFGSPDKLWLAARLGAVLAGVALHGGNRAGVLAWGEHLREVWRPQSSQASLAGLVKAVAAVEPAARIDPVLCLREFSARYGRKCLSVLLSDLLFPEWPQVVSGFAASGCEGYVLQILAADELDPPHLGEVTLVDLEGAGEVPLHIGNDIARLYRREVALFLQEVRHSCHRQGLGHAMLASDTPLARILHTDLRQEGLLC
jgi:uncharacterized protein (DUF58 family)